MNIESMRTRSYRSFKVDDAELPEPARARLLAIRRFDELRAAGCSEQAALREIGVSRRTMFRWKAALAASGQRGLAPKSTRPRHVRGRSYKPSDVKAVMDLRRRHPFMGKAPIQRMLERKGLPLSVSTVGRIISRAIAIGHVPRASVCEGRLQPKRRRKFKGWAKRWKYGAKPERPGQLVQIDHMTFSRDGRTVKEFRAVCPVSRFMVARVFSRATAFNAKRFLDDVVEALPVPLQSVQVDGGSEFMAEFEDACEKLGVELRVLPPRRPQWNGRVERANRTARIEFWNFLDRELTVKAVSAKLLEYEFFYNYQRPHSALDYLTPTSTLSFRRLPSPSARCSEPVQPLARTHLYVVGCFVQTASMSTVAKKPVPSSAAFQSPEAEYWYNVMPQADMPLAGAITTGYDPTTFGTILSSIPTTRPAALRRLATFLIQHPEMFSTARSFLGIADKRAYLDLSYIFSRDRESARSARGLCGCYPWEMSKHPMGFFINMLSERGRRQQRCARLLASYLCDHGILDLAANLKLGPAAIKAIKEHIIDPRESQQQAAKRRGHGCEALLAMVIHQCGVRYLPPNRHIDPLGSRDPNLDMRDFAVRAKSKATRSFDIIVLDDDDNVRVVIQSLVHTSDPGQYGVSKSDETVTVAEELAGEPNSKRQYPIEHWALLDGVGFSENKEKTLNKMLYSLGYFFQLNTLFKVPLRLHVLDMCQVVAVRFNRLYRAADVDSIASMYVPKDVRLLGTRDRPPRGSTAIDGGRATVFVQV